jgi:predicted kinase
MSEIERDHVLRRAVQTLQQLPSTDADAIRRVVEAAAAQRVMPAADEPVGVSAVVRSRRRPWKLAGFAGLVAAAAVVGLFVRGPMTR